MNDNDILATFKKHLCGIKEVDSDIVKNQIHNFGETMKGINEFVGAIQTISLNLTKIKDVSEKIQWIDDLLNAESNTLNLQTERHNYLSSIKHIVDNTKFMDIALFDVELSCVINGKQFSLDVPSPVNYLNDDIYEYCVTKINELSMLQSQISKCLNGEDNASSINDYSDVKGDLLNLFK
ncbi:MAG: hypothetical protein IKC84_00825 [Helicobacteraceae bacterium]|nr:hypothetical protein [Helicobacteraceae bacterium]